MLKEHMIPDIIKSGVVYKSHKELHEDYNYIYDRLNAAQDVSGEKFTKQPHSDSYGFVASGPSELVEPVTFVKLLKEITERKGRNKLKMVDLGCGLSPLFRVFYNNRHLVELRGIELQKQLVEYGNRLFGYTDYIEVSKKKTSEWGTLVKNKAVKVNPIIEGDLKRLNQECRELITEADILYAYTPLSNRVEYKKVLHKIVGMMKKGSYFIEIYGGKGILKEDSRLQNYNKLSWLFKKK